MSGRLDRRQLWTRCKWMCNIRWHRFGMSEWGHLYEHNWQLHVSEIDAVAIAWKLTYWLLAFSCTCTAGWVGLHCARRTVDCLASSSTELCGKGACVHTNDAVGYRCICDQGWTTNNVTPACTVDIDECRSPQPHCSMDPETMCINLPGSYMCGHCPPGLWIYKPRAWTRIWFIMISRRFQRQRSLLSRHQRMRSE